MSSYSNQAPLRRAERSDSQHSLYTDNSGHSDSPPRFPPEHKLPKQISVQTSLHAELARVVPIAEEPPRREDLPRKEEQRTPPKRQ
jgi:hypothetical protein